MIEEIREEEYVSPLVVHNKDDASYQEASNEAGLQTTHIDEDSGDEPTLERHRFRKKKKKKYPYVIAIVVVLSVFLAVLVAKGVINIGNHPEEDTTVSTTKSYTTQSANSFEGIITVKGSYIFFEGEEVEGVAGLEKEIKYLKAGTKFTIQDENADSDFLNFEVLSLLSQYEFDYDITHIMSSGLISQYETTKATTKKPKKSKNKSDAKKKETSKKRIVTSN